MLLSDSLILFPLYCPLVFLSLINTGIMKSTWNSTALFGRVELDQIYKKTFYDWKASPDTSVALKAIFILEYK